jgi:hypothetical protein
MQRPTEHHWNAAKNVLRYLSGTPEVGIVFKQGGGSLVGYRSTTGYVFLLGGGAVSWASKVQPTVYWKGNEPCQQVMNRL